MNKTGFLDTDSDLVIDPEDIIEIDTDKIHEDSFEYAASLIDNLQEVYGDEELMKRMPNVKKHIDTELDALAIQLNMRLTNEELHDTLVRAIGKNPGTASLYVALRGMQMSVIKIQDKIDEIIERLKKLLKNLQYELNFNQEENEIQDNSSTNEQSNDIKASKGSKDFIAQMQAQAASDGTDEA